MGLGSNGKKVRYRLEKLTRTEVGIAAAHLQSNNTNDNNTNLGRPAIYVDANNVINKVGRLSVDPVARTAEFFKEFSAEGLILCPVCDGERPQSKQQTNKNRAQRIKNKHNATIYRQHLRNISRQLKEGVLDEAARKTLEEEQKKLTKSIKTAETSSTDVVPSDYAEQLEAHLVKISAHDVQPGGGFVRRVVAAKFEADALIKGECKKSNFQMVMSEDADYAADLGDKCVSIGNFGSKQDIVLSCTSKAPLLNVLDALGKDTKAELVDPAHPIYEGLGNAKVRSLISVIIGCDVHPGGLPGIGPGKLQQKMKELKKDNAITDKEALYNSLMDYAVNVGPSKISKDVLETFVKGIMYQPTNECGCDDGEHTYLFDEPHELPNYLAEFKTGTTTMKEGPAVLQCKGPCLDSSHTFLTAVDHCKCNKCNVVVCKLCSTCSTTLTSEKTDKERYCLDCYLFENLLPDEGAGLNNDMTISEMRRELLVHYNFSGANKLPVEEVEEAWLGYELQRQFEAMADKVRFPMYPASALKEEDNWEVLFEFDFAEGATFLKNKALKDEFIPDLLDLSALLAYIIVICNGDFDRIRERRTALTWFEEWFMYFEFKYHQTNIRQWDMEAAWGINHQYIKRVKDCKIALEMAAFRSWPRFATFAEDKDLRNPQKWVRYDGCRVIQWNMTNCPAPAFADASLYRATFSEYYGMNCLKVGIGIQLCGWLVSEKPWTGASDDGTYHSDAGYMDEQKKFQEADKVDGKVIKFRNILDRGYRGNDAAHLMDQLCLQPPSAKSDRRFRGKESIYAGAVARDRSGNERGVRVMKRSGLFKSGFKVGMSAKRFSDAMLLWGFQANFMFKPVH